MTDLNINKEHTPISYSPISTNGLLNQRVERIISDNPLIALDPYVSPTLPPEEKYGIEALRELIVMVVAIVGIVMSNSNSNTKSLWSLLLKPIEVIKSLKALYDAGSFIIKKYKQCFNEITDISRDEAWLLVNILVSEFKTVLGKPSDEQQYLEKYKSKG